MPPSKKQIVVYGGLDLAPKHDSTGLVFVTRQGDELILVRHHLWVPTPERPLHLPDVKQAIYQAAHDLTFGGLLVDPYQAHGLIAELRRDGLPVAEYPQTVANLTRMGQALLDALTQQRLRLYPDATFRQQALNTVAIESPRGFRISKTTGGRKIDLIVALAMAVVAALDSADVWSNQELFILDRTVGTPPDAFSETGQRWGLPMPSAAFRLSTPWSITASGW